MKKILSFLLTTSFMLAVASPHTAYSCENQKTECATPLTFKKLKLKTLEPNEKTDLAQILVTRLKYVLAVLAESASKKYNMDVAEFDNVMLELRNKINTLRDKLSSKNTDLLSDIDRLTAQESPNYNLQLVNCYMELRLDFTKQFFHRLCKNFMKVKTDYDFTLPLEFEIQLEEASSNTFYFFSLNNFENKNNSGKNTDTMNLLDTLIKVSEKFELPDKIKTEITSDLLKSRATLKILHKTCSTFETSLGLFIEKARPLFELYKKLLTSLIPNPNGENLQALGVLDALLLCSSTTKTITQSLNSLQNLLTIIKETRFVQKYLDGYCLQKDGDPFLNPKAPSKELRNETLGNLLQTPGFMFLFWGTFIDNGLEKRMDSYLINDFLIEKDTAENAKLFKKINSVYLLFPLLEKTIEQLKSTQNNFRKNQDKQTEELEQKKNLKNQKKYWKKQKEKALTTLFSGEQKCQKKEIAPVEEEFSTTDTPTTTTNTPCNKTAKTLKKAKKEKCEKVLAPLNAHNSTQQAIDVVNNFFEQTKTPTFFKLNDIILTESHLTSSAGDFLKGVVIAYKKPENPLDLEPEDIDFSTLSTHEIFHKTAVESLRKNPDLLKKCEKIERDDLGECGEKSLKNTIGLWLQNDTTLIALLPCLIRTSSDKSKNLFKEISGKIKEGSLLGDRLALGLHKGTIALLLTHSKTKSDEFKYKAQHLFFHEDTETKQFHINKK